MTASGVKRQSQAVVVARRLSRNPSAVLGLVVALFLVIIAVFAPLLA
ncbi:MAG TPA: ABC transporter permease, partial [Anaerolineae bacterium]|nr:ABC transporter permease [Anaerolineae bacterium]